jgi:hypothetical protein
MDSPAQHSTSGKNTGLAVLSCCFVLTATPHNKASFPGRKAFKLLLACALYESSRRAGHVTGVVVLILQPHTQPTCCPVMQGFAHLNKCCKHQQVALHGCQVCWGVACTVLQGRVCCTPDEQASRKAGQHC